MHLKKLILLSIILSLGYTDLIGETSTVYQEDTNDQISKVSDKFYYHGEYGLWVTKVRKKLKIHWITMEEDSGYVTVIDEKGNKITIKTGKALAHNTVTKQPKGDLVTLQYGSLTNSKDKNTTRINFRTIKTSPKTTLKNIDSIYVFGDVHGEFETLKDLMLNHGLIDTQYNWKGGKKSLIFLGDIFDRGPDVIRILWFIYQLEEQARASGGRVVLILGNHEIMTIVGDLHYLSEKEAQVAKLHKTDYKTLFNPTSSVLGKWLTSRLSVMKIDKLLFSHGGIIKPYTVYSIQEINRLAKSYMNDKLFPNIRTDTVHSTKAESIAYMKRMLFFYGEKCPYWFRGYVLTDSLNTELDAALKKFSVNSQVIAHTPVKTIKKLYNGKIIATDLKNPADEMLLLVREKNNSHRAFKLLKDGSKSEI